MKRWNCTLTREIIFVRQIEAQSASEAERAIGAQLLEDGDADFKNVYVEMEEVEETPDADGEAIEVDEMEGGL